MCNVCFQTVVARSALCTGQAIHPVYSADPARSLLLGRETAVDKMRSQYTGERSLSRSGRTGHPPRAPGPRRCSYSGILLLIVQGKEFRHRIYNSFSFLTVRYPMVMKGSNIIILSNASHFRVHIVTLTSQTQRLLFNSLSLIDKPES